jgi:hypothetical protein
LTSLKGRDHSEDPGVYGRIILEGILSKYFGICIDCIHMVQNRKPVAGSREHDNEITDVIKGGEFLSR